MFIGIPYVLIIAVAVFIVATVITTEFLKRFLYISPIIISWFVGAIIFFILFLFVKEVESLNIYAVFLFIIITALTNGSYKQFDFIKEIAKKIARSKL